MAKPRSFARLMLNGWGVIGLFGLVFCVIFSTISMLAGRTAERLASDGVTTEAVVTDKEVRRSSSGTTNVQGYRLDYEFDVEGNRFQGRDGVRREVYVSSGLGTKILIRYWETDPEVSGIVPVDAGTEAVVTRNIALGAGAVMLAGFGVSFRRAAGFRRLQRHGEKRRAVVTDLEKAFNKPNKVPRYSVVWRDETGARGQSIPYRRQYLPDEGEEITVFVDPATGQSAWEYALFHLPRRS